ncbi:MAG: glycosyltransferase, partial [Planctomycetota bacterium]|nr:glycosyltransferase [Planctomycetota bacterium]
DGGLPHLLDAVRGMSTRLHVELVGTGPAASWLEFQIARLGLTDRMSLAGWVDPRSLARRWFEADLALLPGERPGSYGCAGLEALSRGVPVVAVDRGGLGPWLVEGLGGWLVPPGDPQALRDAIEHALVNREATSRLAASGRARLARDFAPAAYLDQLEQHLFAAVRSA